MDAFEQVVAMLLRREGWWTMTSVKVELTKAEKVQIGRPSSPRWEIDVVAYRGASNEVLAVECKSFLDSPGVHMIADELQPPDRYKLFSEPLLRKVVLGRLCRQLHQSGACAADPLVRLGLAAGKIRSVGRRQQGEQSAELNMRRVFDAKGWWLWTPGDLRQRLQACEQAGYENDAAYVVAKLMGRQ